MKVGRAWGWIPGGLLVISIGLMIGADHVVDNGARDGPTATTAGDRDAGAKRDTNAKVVNGSGPLNAAPRQGNVDIAFQGRFLDDVGLPLTDSHDLYFRIFDDLGNPRFSSGPVAVTLINGVATTEIPDVPQDVFDRFAPYRLDVSVDDSGFTSPFSVDLEATPFAVKSSLALSANDSDTVDGSHAADFAIAGHVHAGQDITSGTVDEAFIDDDIARDNEITAAIQDHRGIPDAHHARYTDEEAVAAVSAAGIGVPSGTIVMWSGSTIPNGWHLCNGLNGTPDLRNRFVVSAGGEYSVGDTGGEKEHVLTIAEIPPHHHTYQHHPTWRFSGDTEMGGKGNLQNFETEDTGGGQAHENRPPYYALAFIMKE